MPLYEYECDACGHRFEKIQKFSDPPLETCPKCGGPVHKLMSAPAFQFKGTGWYVTDYAEKGRRPPPALRPTAPRATRRTPRKTARQKSKSSNEGTKERAKEGAKETSKDASSAKSETSTSTSETTSPKTNP